MSRENVLVGVRRNNGAVTKKMQSIKLNQRLTDNERKYRTSFLRFVDTFKNAAENSECLSQTKIKTIAKIMDEVVKGSDDLLLAFDKRRSAYQSSEAIYENINAHHLQTVDGLYTYCTQLQDISNLLQEACATGIGNADKISLPDALHEALLPVHHVQELLNIFQEVKKDLVKNRRLVEIFSCNTLIEQLTKELKKMRKVIKSIHADSLLGALDEMATIYSYGVSVIDSTAQDLAKEIEESSPLSELTASHEQQTEKVSDPDNHPKKEAEQAKAQTPLEATNSEHGQLKAVCTEVKIKRSSNVPQSRRDSKNQVRQQMKSLSSRLSEMKDELLSLERKVAGLKLYSADSNSESEDECTKDTFSASSKVKKSAGSRRINGDDDASFEGVEIRSSSTFSRIKQHQALLRSSMRRAPLYQKYQKFQRDNEEGAPASEGEDAIANIDVANGVEDDIGLEDTRPESGIVMEEGFQDHLYEFVLCDRSKPVECYGNTDDYVQMNKAGKDNTLIVNGTELRKNTQNLIEVPSANCTFHPRRYSLQASHSDYVSIIHPNYANMIMDPIYQEQPESVYSTVHDIFGAEKNEKDLNDEEKICLEELPSIVRHRSITQRTGWCQIPMVKESGVLESMTRRQRNLQEAKYELISSKVSYLKSLSVLQSVFIGNESLREIMTPVEWDNLFQHIGPIKKCSEHFLSDLLSGWPRDIFMTNQLSVVRKYAESGLQAYVDFCANKITMDETLKNIRENNPSVNKALKELEREEICDSHDLESFLVLPIQRITRFPLLVEGILHRMDINVDKDFCDWAKTYDKLLKMAKRCNEAVREAENLRTGSKYSRSHSATLPAKKHSHLF